MSRLIKSKKDKIEKQSSTQDIFQMTHKLNEAVKLMNEANKMWDKMNNEDFDIVSQVFEENLDYNLGLFADSLEKSIQKLNQNK